MTSLAVGPGTHILVYGASGAIGSAGVQLAKELLFASLINLLLL